MILFSYQWVVAPPREFLRKPEGFAVIAERKEMKCVLESWVKKARC